MHRKIEFFTFYIFWCACWVSLIAQFKPYTYVPFAVAVDVSFIVYAWVRFSNDQVVHDLRGFLYFALLASMILGICTKYIMPLVLIGPVFLGYLRLEGGFRHGTVSGQPAGDVPVH